jgi:hypothetical protein
MPLTDLVNLTELWQILHVNALSLFAFTVFDGLNWLELPLLSS